MKYHPQWVDSIQSVVKRTEDNIQRIRSRPTSALSYIDESYRPGTNYGFQNDTMRCNQYQYEERTYKEEKNDLNVLQQFNSLKQQFVNDYDRLYEKLSELYQENEEIKLKNLEIQSNFEKLQLKVAKELEKTEQDFTCFVTKEDLRNREEIIKYAHLTQIQQIEESSKKIINQGFQIEDQVWLKVKEQIDAKLLDFVRKSDIKIMQDTIKSQLIEMIDKSTQEQEYLRNMSENMLLGKIDDKMNELESSVQRELFQQYKQTKDEIHENKQFLGKLIFKNTKDIKSIKTSKSSNDMSLLNEKMQANSKQFQKELAGVVPVIYDLKARLQRIESQKRTHKQDKKQVNRQALVTFGKRENLSPIKEFKKNQPDQQLSSEYETVSLNDLGPSDSESNDIVSPSPSPLNRLIAQHSKLVKDNKFSFDKKAQIDDSWDVDEDKPKSSPQVEMKQNNNKKESKYNYSGKENTRITQKESIQDAQKKSTWDIQKESTWDVEKESSQISKQESTFDAKKKNTWDIQKESTWDVQKESSQNFQRKSNWNIEENKDSRKSKENTWNIQEEESKTQKQENTWNIQDFQQDWKLESNQKDSTPDRPSDEVWDLRYSDLDASQKKEDNPWIINSKDMEIQQNPAPQKQNNKIENKKSQLKNHENVWAQNQNKEDNLWIIDSNDMEIQQNPTAQKQTNSKQSKESQQNSHNNTQSQNKDNPSKSVDLQAQDSSTFSNQPSYTPEPQKSLFPDSLSTMYQKKPKKQSLPILRLQKQENLAESKGPAPGQPQESPVRQVAIPKDAPLDFAPSASEVDESDVSFGSDIQLPF